MRLHTLWIGEYRQLQDVTLEFAPDSPITAITGANGVGKTTLLEALAIIFRDLHANTPPAFPFRLVYSIEDRMATLDATVPGTLTASTPNGSVTAADLPDTIGGYAASGTRIDAVFADASGHALYVNANHPTIQTTVQSLLAGQHPTLSPLLHSAFGSSNTLNEAGAGERQLMELVALLDHARDRNALLLWDLPDSFLHPAWARLLLPTLQQLLGNDSPACLLCTSHNPLTLGSLYGNHVIVLQRDGLGTVVAEPADADPKGLGAEGILTSDIFGLKSTLDLATDALLQRRNILAGMAQHTPAEAQELETLSADLARLGFSRTSTDAVYQQFLEGLNRRGLFDTGTTRGVGDENGTSAIDEILDEMLGV